MKSTLYASALCLIASAGFAQNSEKSVGPIDSTAKTGRLNDGSQLVVTGQLVRPWGAQIYLPGRPVDIALDAGKSKIAVLNSKSIDVMDVNGDRCGAVLVAVPLPMEALASDLEPTRSGG